MSATISTPASGFQTIDGLLCGTEWNLTTLTYGFPTVAADYGGLGYAYDDDGNAATPDANETTNMGPLAAAARAATVQAMTELAAVTLMNVQLLTTNPGTARLRFAETSTPRAVYAANAAYANFPNETKAGDTWFDTGAFGSAAVGSYAYITTFHELGHLLGLKHGQAFGGPNNVPLPSEWDSTEFSLMTYTAFIGDTIPPDWNHAAGAYPQSWMMLDIRALQEMYGANYATNSGATTYAFDPSTGRMSIDGVSQGTPAINTLFRTIWDGGGWDTYDFSAYRANHQLNIDLRPGFWSDVDGDSTFQAAYLGGGPNGGFARGQVANALLFNGNTDSLIEAALGGAGADTITGNQLGNWLEGRAGRDTLIGLQGDDQLFAGTGGGLLDGGFDNDTLYAGSGPDLLDGGDGRDVADYSTSTRRVQAHLHPLFWGSNGLDADADTYVGVEDLTGTKYNDTLGGDDAANIIHGLDSFDILIGRSGADTLFGDQGNDTLQGGLGADSLVGGSGNDEASYADAAAAVVVDMLFPDQFFAGEAAGDRFISVENLRGSAFADALGGNDVANTIHGGLANDTVAGRGGRDYLYGDESNDTLYGDGEGDTLWGGTGNDALYGGTGNDLLIGGLGNDSYYVDSDADLVRETAAGLYQGNGYDIVYASASFTLHATEADIEELRTDVDSGTAAINLTGNARGSTFVGNAGNNRIDGRGGADIMQGLGGFDTYFVDDAGDQVIEANVAGFDSVFATVSYTLGAGQFIEKLVLTGIAGISGTGNALNNTIIGNDAGNRLASGGGRDLLDGKGGADTIDGGADRDTVRGGEAGDLIDGKAGNDLLQGEGGDDTITGGDGRDTLKGGDGNDILYIDSSDGLVEGGTGFDTANAVAATVPSGFTFTASAASSLELIQGNDGNDSINAAALTTTVTIIAFAGNDTLRGGSGDDALSGLEGNDSLLGGLGFDQMHGGVGNDTIVGGGGPANPPFADWLFGDEGDDLLFGSGSGQVIGGSGSDTIEAGAGDYVDGGADNDLIHGGAGAERIIGGGGDDTMTGGAGADLFDFADGWGHDRITDFQVGVDRFRMSDVSGLNTFQQIVRADVAGGASVGFAGNSILVIGLTAAQLVEADFLI
jgi:serralysin